MLTTRTRRLSLAVLTVAVLSLGAACSSGGGGSSAGTTTTAAGAGTSTTSALGVTSTTTAAAGAAAGSVTIKDFAYSQTGKLAAGATVKVVNSDSVPHTLTADDNSFDSGVINGGQSGSVKLPSTPGTYQVKCLIHPNMRGQITVS